MTHRDVRFLDARGARGRHGHGDVAERSERIGSGAGQRDRLAADFPRRFRRTQNVFRLSTGADRDQDVAGLREARNLSSKHLFVTQIVAHRGQC